MSKSHHRYHDSLSASHPGHLRTMNLIQNDYWWPGMYTFIKNYTDVCAICQQSKINWLTNGYTCHCHKKTTTKEPASPKTDTTTIEAPLSPTTVQQLDDFYSDKASYLTFQTKVIHEPSFTTFDYAYHSHWSLKHQITKFRWLKNSSLHSELWMKLMLLLWKLHFYKYIKDL